MGSLKNTSIAHSSQRNEPDEINNLMNEWTKLIIKINLFMCLTDIATERSIMIN